MKCTVWLFWHFVYDIKVPCKLIPQYCFCDKTVCHCWTLGPLISKSFPQIVVHMPYIKWYKNIGAAFRGMHVSPAKHSYVWLPRKCDYRTDRQTDARQSDPYVPLCFAGDTTRKTTLSNYLVLCQFKKGKCPVFFLIECYLFTSKKIKFPIGRL